MSDHLNSIHLEAPRREEFRHARARLLDACGERTRYVMHQPEAAPEAASDSRTIYQDLENRLPVGAEYALLDKNRAYPLKFGLNTIGRLPDNDIVIEDAFVSRRHCAVLVHTNNGFEIHDVASKNGTFVNGNKLAGPIALKSGDEIRMCDKQLIFVCKAEPRQAPEHAATLMK
jgi:pSer/pThr/pTyr-binding forkhead associated (FHA) protein